MGYKLYQPQNRIGRDFVNCWIHGDIVKEGDYVKNQTLDYSASVMQLAGLLIERGRTDIKVNHSDDVDVSTGDIGFEYEHADGHNPQEIIAKKERGLLKYKKIIL